MRVSVPASSANLGPGFDTLGLALSIPFVLSNEADDRLLAANEHHPASVAFAAAGGSGSLWWRSRIPPGRGMGFSGAARVAGAFLAYRLAGLDDADARRKGFELATQLEGHPDNAGASMFGGAVASAAGRAVRIPMAVDLKVVVWWPDTETSTNKSRTRLPDTVAFADAVHNVGHVAVLVAALASGDTDVLSVAMSDRLHEASRLEMSPQSGVALSALRSSRAVAAWLSGSGPTVAAFVRAEDADQVLFALPAGGTSKILDIDLVGAQVLEASTSLV